MVNDPVLARTCYTDRVAMQFEVHGGLRFVRGNRVPYFSLTYWAHRAGHPNQCLQGGANHAVILARFPQFADLAALHLCGQDGAPSLENSWYWYAGALGGHGERYHGANDGQHSPEDCARILTKTVRIDVDSVTALLALTLDQAQFAAWFDAQRPRWRAEAEACIARHGLVLFGDPLDTPDAS